MAQSRRRIGDILTEWGALTQAGVDEALEHAVADGTRLGEALIALGLCDEEDITKALATQFNMEYIDLDQNVTVPPEIILSEEDIKKHQVLPLQLEGNRLRIIITDPLDLEVLDMLRFRLGYELDPCLASRSKLRDYINRNIVGGDLKVERAFEDFEAEAGSGSTIGETDDSEDSSLIIRLVMMILQEAVNGRASDVHVEPMSNRVRVRYRIDGVCIERDNIRKSLQGAVINRMKLMADLDLAERRLPQDGRIKLKVGGQSIDFRVSVLPTHHGQGIVLRILRPESVRVGVEALGFESDDMARFNRIIRRPNGIFLVTGPTGSGKTTTLYSAVNELNRPDQKIITAEDPVEYNFPGVNQVQVNDKIGLTFPNILRSMLRQAPNIILVGEIRDLDVAEIAIQAALTGHLVFSTLHTNDAPSAITRLMDIGVKPFLVASSIQAIMAQRLIRVICKECKEPDPEPDPQHLRLLGYHADEIKNAQFFHGRGCSVCGGTGYRGRQGIFELMEMDPHIRELAFTQAPLSEIRRAAVATNMRPLLEDGKLKVLAGVTTPEELVRIAQSEELSFDDE